MHKGEGIYLGFDALDFRFTLNFINLKYLALKK